MEEREHSAREINDDSATAILWKLVRKVGEFGGSKGVVNHQIIINNYKSGWGRNWMHMRQIPLLCYRLFPSCKLL